MKRFLVGAGLAATLYLLTGFSLVSFQVQTARVRWDTFSQGAAYTTPVTEAEGFSNPFVTSGYSTVGGQALFRADGITCTWAVDGVGAGNMIIDILHEDAGIDCSCTLGACTAGPNVPLPCSCTPFQTLPGSTYQVQVDTTSSCATTEPGQWHCTVDWFR